MHTIAIYKNTHKSLKASVTQKLRQMLQVARRSPKSRKQNMHFGLSTRHAKRTRTTATAAAKRIAQSLFFVHHMLLLKSWSASFFTSPLRCCTSSMCGATGAITVALYRCRKPRCSERERNPK